MMKKVGTLLLLLMVVSSFAARSLKSKRGSIDLTTAKGGGKAVCTVGFSETMTELNRDGDFVRVKASCGKGWASIDAVEQVAQVKGDKSMMLEGVDVEGWLDNPSAVFVLDQDASQFDGIDINRDFKDYLKQTMDRETIEMTNGEN